MGVAPVGPGQSRCRHRIAHPPLPLATAVERRLFAHRHGGSAYPPIDNPTARVASSEAIRTPQSVPPCSSSEVETKDG